MVKKIDWKKVAKDHDMDYEEFGEELYNITMAFMQEKCKEVNANEMIITKGKTIQLIYKEL